MDRALWISWYDLPENGRDAYLAWLHGTHMHNVVKRPGILWAAHFRSEAKPIHSGVPRGSSGRLRHTDDPAVPKGAAYILIYGAENAHDFARPTTAKYRAGLSAGDRKMIATRIGERINIFTDENGVGGPEAGRRDPKLALSPCIQLGSFGAGTADEDELLDWYANWRLPSMSRLPGCVGCRKLVSVSGWAKHSVLYEFVSLAARNEHFPDHEDASPEKAAWTDRLVRQLIHAPGSPNVAQRIASTVK